MPKETRSDIRYKQMDRAKLERMVRYIRRHCLYVEAVQVSAVVIRECTNLHSNEDCDRFAREIWG